MRQIIQSLKTGDIAVEEIPCPRTKPGHLLIRTRTTLVSAGTERMLLEFGKAGWIQKVRSQPDKVKMVLDKMRTDGIGPTLDAVKSKLDQPLPMGYCNVGTVIEVGDGVTGFKVGDRVLSNGPHAEVVCVPKNLCAPVPDGVSDDAAAFTVLGAIGLQGIRLAQPTLGEAFVVMGMGLIGLITAQLLRAHGCRVLGTDFNPKRLELARQFGVETVDLSAGQDPVTAAETFSRGRGVDGVLITASTQSSEPVHQAALMCRKRGRIVLIGVTGLELSRADFYEKELSFQVSCSYGPGRYDPDYEEKGRDYPLGFVRWTEGRNFEAFLDVLAEGRLDVAPLVSYRFPLERAGEAYAAVSAGEGLGILFEYPDEEAKPTATLLNRRVALPSADGAVAAPTGTAPVLGFIGSGDYAQKVLIPAMKETGAVLKTVASSGGVSANHAAKKFGFREATTDTEALLSDPEVHAVVVSTRHDSHARFVVKALRAGKHVFVEKPLALTSEEVGEISETYRAVREAGIPLLLMVGFNRRFAPHVIKAKELLKSVDGPKSMVMTVNAGAIPPEHWVHDPKVGGGRIIGEGCHFVDLLRFMADSPIVGVDATGLGGEGDDLEDKASITLRFADGSFGVVHYLANGHKTFPKERLEVFCAGRTLQLDNFRALRGYGWPGFKEMRLRGQDKGQKACAAAFVGAVQQGKPAPIPYPELVETAEATFEAVRALRRNRD